MYYQDFNFHKIMDTQETSKYLTENMALARQVLRKEDWAQLEKVYPVVCAAAAHHDFARYAWRENAGRIMCLLEDIKLGYEPKEGYKSPDYIVYPWR